MASTRWKISPYGRRRAAPGRRPTAVAAQILAKPVTIIGDDPAVDIFTAAWSVKYAGAVGQSGLVDVEGISIPVVGIADLIASKRTGRLQDAADIEVLEEILRLRRGYRTP